MKLVIPTGILKLYEMFISEDEDIKAQYVYDKKSKNHIMVLCC